MKNSIDGWMRFFWTISLGNFFGIALVILFLNGVLLDGLCLSWGCDFLNLLIGTALGTLLGCHILRLFDCFDKNSLLVTKLLTLMFVFVPIFFVFDLGVSWPVVVGVFSVYFAISVLCSLWYVFWMFVVDYLIWDFLFDLGGR